MYLEHFKLEKPPFSLTPNTDFYCEFLTHREALNVLTLCLQDGEGFIKILGEVGVGKTLLCRLLLNTLDEHFVTAYIPNPDQAPESFHRSFATELGIRPEKEFTQFQLLNAINLRLLELHQAGKKTILIVDEAQALSDACLEAVRLLTNLETEAQKLLQVVLFAQPELNAKLNQPHMRQLKQRITFSYQLKPLNKEELDVYLFHRLAKAGYTYGSLFSKRAQKKLFRASVGLPRLLNILCHKSLLVAYGMGLNKVGVHEVKQAILDTESVHPYLLRKKRNRLLLAGCGSLIILAILFFKIGLIG